MSLNLIYYIRTRHFTHIVYYLPPIEVQYPLGGLLIVENFVQSLPEKLTTSRMEPNLLLWSNFILMVSLRCLRIRILHIAS